MDIEKVVYDVFSGVCKNKDITKETAIKDLGIDSLDLVEALMDLEEKVGVEFSEDEYANLKTVGDVFTAIEAKLK